MPDLTVSIVTYYRTFVKTHSLQLAKSCYNIRMALVVLTIRIPRESENTPEQTAQLLASLARATRKPSLMARLTGSIPVYVSLEVTVSNGQVMFAIVYPEELGAFITSQILATYQDAVAVSIQDYLADWAATPPAVSIVKQQYAAYFPLRDYADYTEVDPMLPILGVLTKAAPEDKILVQFILTPPSPQVMKAAYRYLHPVPKTDSSGKTVAKEPPPEGKKLIDDKLSQPLVGVSIRFASNNPYMITSLQGAISVLNRPDGNSLVPATLFPWQKSKLWDDIRYRLPFKAFHHQLSTLNVMELSSLWHLPGVYTKLPNIAWAPSRSLVEAPENLPVFIKPDPADPNAEAIANQNADVNFFAKTQYKNEDRIFGIKLEDRLRHMYILGKSGTGKSTLLENMTVDDFKKGRGVAFVDPHGDSAEALLNYIPSNRINDVIYFNPADREYPISLNMLEVVGPDQAELVASSIVAIFHKLYGNSWGPRLEYILRNTLLTLTYVPGSTLPDVVRILTDSAFRKSLYPKVQNPQLMNFWQNEYDRLEEKTRLDHISSILNKVGQFVNSPLIHNLISQSKSSIRLEDVLNTGKILIVNLSQGKLGEDNAALLGAMFITKIQLAAMARVDIPKEQRKEFFLYVDEFQNFATESFIKILSEARKFKLGLVLANQYMAQIPEEIQKAIFGNAGTVASFVLGADDAGIMEKEFGEKFSAESLVSLDKHQIAMKMTINAAMSQPFMATTLPPLKSTNQNKDKVLRISRERWGKKIKES